MKLSGVQVGGVQSLAPIDIEAAGRVNRAETQADMAMINAGITVTNTATQVIETNRLFEEAKSEQEGLSRAGNAVTATDDMVTTMSTSNVVSSEDGWDLGDGEDVYYIHSSGMELFDKAAKEAYETGAEGLSGKGVEIYEEKYNENLIKKRVAFQKVVTNKQKEHVTTNYLLAKQQILDQVTYGNAETALEDARIATKTYLDTGLIDESEVAQQSIDLRYDIGLAAMQDGIVTSTDVNSLEEVSAEVRNSPSLRPKDRHALSKEAEAKQYKIESAHEAEDTERREEVNTNTLSRYITGAISYNEAIEITSTSGNADGVLKIVSLDKGKTGIGPAFMGDELKGHYQAAGLQWIVAEDPIAYLDGHISMLLGDMNDPTKPTDPVFIQQEINTALSKKKELIAANKNDTTGVEKPSNKLKSTKNSMSTDLRGYDLTAVSMWDKLEDNSEPEARMNDLRYDMARQDLDDFAVLNPNADFDGWWKENRENYSQEVVEDKIAADYGVYVIRDEDNNEFVPNKINISKMEQHVRDTTTTGTRERREAARKITAYRMYLGYKHDAGTSAPQSTTINAMDL